MTNDDGSRRVAPTRLARKADDVRRLKREIDAILDALRLKRAELARAIDGLYEDVEAA